jgi:hypothetical protein
LPECFPFPTLSGYRAFPAALMTCSNRGEDVQAAGRRAKALPPLDRRGGNTCPFRQLGDAEPAEQGGKFHEPALFELVLREHLQLQPGVHVLFHHGEQP